MNVLIFLIILVYNVESLLDCCIRSLLKKPHNHLEIILINEGSNDIIEAICENYALQIPVI